MSSPGASVCLNLNLASPEEFLKLLCYFPPCRMECLDLGGVHPLTTGWWSRPDTVWPLAYIVMELERQADREGGCSYALVLSVVYGLQPAGEGPLLPS